MSNLFQGNVFYLCMPVQGSDLDLVVALSVLGGLNEQGPERDCHERHSKLVTHLAGEDCISKNRYVSIIHAKIHLC